MRGLPMLLLLLLFAAAVSGCERKTSPAVPRTAAATRNPAMDSGCRAPFRTAVCLITLKRRGRYFRARGRYYANSDATRQSCRLQFLVSGDIHPNPGPRSEVPPASHQLNIYYQNVRSLKNKLTVLRSEAPALRKYDVISLTETWLNSDVETAELELGLAGYTVFRRDRRGRIGGGVAVAVKTNLLPRRRDDLESDCECLVVQIGVLPARNCLVVTMYRPPDDPASLTQFYQCAQAVTATGLPATFCGDFNLRYLRWEAAAETGIIQHSFTRNCDRRLSLEFVDNLELHGLQQLVSEPTGESGTFLDLVLANIPGSATVCDSVFSSDHCALSVTVRVRITRRLLPTRSRALNYKRADWDGLRATLGLCPWYMLDQMEVNDAVDFFYDLLETAVSDHVPAVTLSKKHPPWFDNRVRAALRAKENAFVAKKRNPTPEKESDFRSKRKVFKDLAASKYRSYLVGLIGDFRNTPKRFWSFLKAVKLSRGLPPILFFRGKTATTSKDKANLLNDCFGSKFSVPSDPRVPLPVCKDLGLSSFNSLTVSVTRVACLLSALDRSKACGADNLSGFILRECADVLATPLSVIFNKCLRSGVFPTRWKDATVIPVHKKGPHDQAGNYRSVSLLPIVSKVFEKILCDSLARHISPAISSSQHGFVRGRSCVTNLSEFMFHATSALQSKSQLEVIYTDFSSAFQSVDHRFLLHKLKTSFGISGQMLALFSSYLTHRRQRVVVDGVTSEWCAVASGVPEGSVLGPSLFLAFINDLPELFDSNCLLYADDLKVFRTVEAVGDSELLQNDLNRLHSWSQIWHITLNPIKCLHLRVSLKSNPLPVRFSIGGIKLSQVTSMRDLGVIIDSRLNFSDHIDFVVKRGNRALGLLIRSLQGVRGGYCKRGVIAAYYANVRSILEYGSVIWAGAASSHLERLERVQHKFLSFLAGTRRDRFDMTDYEGLCLSYKVDALEKRRTASDLSFLHGVISGKIESSLLLGQFSLRVPARETRSPEFLFVPPSRVMASMSALFSRLPRALNTFVQSHPSFDIFCDSKLALLRLYYSAA